MPLNSTLSQQIFSVISALTRIKNEVDALENELADKAGVSKETVAVAVRLRHLGVVPGTAYSKGNDNDDLPPAA